MAAAGRIVIFGAGSIGRSFIGEVFNRGGWEVVFVDVDSELVAAINERRGYTVVVRRQGEPEEAISVRGVRAIEARRREAVTAELASADLAATCVGKAALPQLVPSLVAGLVARGRASEAGPRSLDLIIAENDREACDSLRRGLLSALPAGFPLHERLGLVETSIGKMVPIPRAADVARDRLRVVAEAYSELIVDRHGFLGALPRLPDLVPVDNIRAWVDRKLFIHNLGHAAVAYLGRRADPTAALICEALALSGVATESRRAMHEAATALLRAYPAEFTADGLEGHIEDLLSRFANAALGDSVYRVGRDLPRKLHRSDRVVGAALLCEENGTAWGGIASVFAAALRFDAVDETGAATVPDREALALLEREGLDSFMTKVCALDAADRLDARVRSGLSAAARAGFR